MLLNDTDNLLVSDRSPHYFRTPWLLPTYPDRGPQRQICHILRSNRCHFCITVAGQLVIPASALKAQSQGLSPARAPATLFGVSVPKVVIHMPHESPVYCNSDTFKASHTAASPAYSSGSSYVLRTISLVANFFTRSPFAASMRASRASHMLMRSRPLIALMMM